MFNPLELAQEIRVTNIQIMTTPVHKPSAMTGCKIAEASIFFLHIK
jgi:hypothetical protein